MDTAGKGLDPEEHRNSMPALSRAHTDSTPVTSDLQSTDTEPHGAVLSSRLFFQVRAVTQDAGTEHACQPSRHLRVKSAACTLLPDVLFPAFLLPCWSLPSIWTQGAWSSAQCCFCLPSLIYSYRLTTCQHLSVHRRLASNFYLHTMWQSL